jgi:Raf kinase inhibitor-like YbhB/YbcL family protein
VELGSLAVTSSSFSPMHEIPVDYTCDGADKSPPIAWSAPPAGTRSFAIVVDDPDAPSGTFTHFVAYNLPPDARALPEGADPSGLGGATTDNDFGRPGYAGPCPPKREIHHYNFRVFALNTPIEVKAGGKRGEVDGAMNGHVLAQGVLTAVFAH